jgi:hypothetical protein
LDNKNAGAISPHLPPPPIAAGASNTCETFRIVKERCCGEAVLRWREKAKSPEVSRRSGLRGKHECDGGLRHQPPGDERVPDLFERGRREAVRTRAGAWVVQSKMCPLLHFQVGSFVLRE